LGPEIDRALAKLKESDRGAIVLRYFQGRPVAEVAAALGLSEEGATKRLQRAIGKLRAYFTRRRIAPPTTAAAFTAALAELSGGVAAPPALAQAAAAGALSASAATGTSFLIAKGAMNMILWNNVKATALAVLALVVAVTAGVGTISLVRAADPPAAPPPARANAADDPKAINADYHPPIVALLDNGVSIEVVSVAPSPSNGKPGWRADGSPVPAALYAGISTTVQGAPGQRTMEFAVHLDDQVGADGSMASVRWGIKGSGASGGGAARDAKGRDVPGLEVRAVALPGNPAAATLHADVAAGAWRTQFQAGPDGQVMGKGNETFHFSPMFDLPDGGGSVVIFVHGGAAAAGGDDRVASRVVAVNRAGQVRPARVRRMVNSGAISSGEYAVPFPRKDVKELQYQTRPYDQWMEIRNVSLDPAKPTKVEVATSDAK
jgi:hypothetical protein